MAKLGSTVDARLLRISPYAIRAIEQGGAAMGEGYASIGASAAKAIRSYADMKKEQRLTDEEKEEEVQKNKRAINYIRGLDNPETGERYTAGQSRDMVKAIGSVKALEQIKDQKNVADQIKAAADLARAERIADNITKQADRSANLLISNDARTTQLKIAIGNNKASLEIAKLKGADETHKQVYLARIAALEASIKVITDKSGAINANNQLLIDGRAALQKLEDPTWWAEATPEMMRDVNNTVLKAQAEFIGEHYGNFDNLVGWNKIQDDGSIGRELPTGWVRLREELAGFGATKPTKDLINDVPEGDITELPVDEEYAARKKLGQERRAAVAKPFKEVYKTVREGSPSSVFKIRNLLKDGKIPTDEAIRGMSDGNFDILMRDMNKTGIIDYTKLGDYFYQPHYGKPEKEIKESIISQFIELR